MLLFYETITIQMYNNNSIYFIFHAEASEASRELNSQSVWPIQIFQV